MYSEKTYKNYIFWLQVKRLIVIILFSCIGAALGILIGKILESTIKLTSFNNAIIIASTVIFFLLSLLLTVGTGKQVQDGYWRIAVLRKLTVIQKNLELNNDLLRKANYSIKSDLIAVNHEIQEEEVIDDEENISTDDDLKKEELKSKGEEKKNIKKDFPQDTYSVESGNKVENEENKEETAENKVESAEGFDTADSTILYKFDEMALIPQKKKSKKKKMSKTLRRPEELKKIMTAK